MSTIISFGQSIRNRCRHVGNEMLFYDRVVAPARLYVIVAALLALAFAAIAIRGFAPALASALSPVCEAAAGDCSAGKVSARGDGGAVRVAGMPANSRNADF